MPPPATAGARALQVRRARRLLGVFRLLVAVLEVVAIVGNYQYVLGFRLFQTANFFSYFTIQSAFLAVITLVIAGCFALLTTRDPAWLGVLRTMVTVYVVISGIVFGLIVTQASTRAYRIDVPWSDTLLHFVVPALALIAWTTDSILAVNPRVPWQTIGWVLIYPSFWLWYTLVRGQEVGWFPYFFLDETQVGGWGGVAAYCTLCLAIFLSITAALVWLNRWVWVRARTARDLPAPQPGSPHPTAPRVAAPALRR